MSGEGYNARLPSNLESKDWMDMKNSCAVILAFGLLATPALADKKLDDAVAKAEDQLKKGKPDEAEKTLEKAVSQAPSPEGYVALSRFEERLGNWDKAGQALAQATQAASGNPSLQAQALAAQSAFALQRGTGKDALAQADAAVRAESNADSLAALARALARTGDATTALATADKAVAAGATSGAAHAARGDALLALHKNDDAAAAYRKALEVDPKLTRARVGLASALTAAGKGVEAEAEARKATEADAKSGDAFAALGLAILAQNKDNFAKAIAEAQQGAFLDEKNPNVQMAVGQIFENNNLTQSVNAYKKAIATDPGYIPAQLALVTAQERNGDLAGALASGQVLVRDLPKSGEAWARYGRLQLRKADYAGATASLEKATQLAPGLAEAWGLLGTAAQFTGKTDVALNAYKKASEMDPSNDDYRTTLGLLYGINHQADAGIAELKKVVSKPGYKDADGYINLGWVYRNAEPKKTAESIAAYKKAIELEPKNVSAELGLGWAYTFAKDWDNSIAAFKKAIELDPGVSGEANNGIAWCYFFKKDIPSVKTYAEKAKAGGRNVDSLLANVDRYEKALAQSKEAAERALAEVKEPKDEAVGIGSIMGLLRSKDPNQRINGCRGAVQFRAQGVPYLTGIVQDDPSFQVRAVCAKALGDIGSAAKDGLPTLKYWAAAPLQAECTICEKEQLKAQTDEQDFRRAVKDAVTKIQH
jgi:tetratricopeptide (TPR) repeat protein